MQESIHIMSEQKSNTYLSDELGAIVGNVVVNLLKDQIRKNPHGYYAGLFLLSTVISGVLFVAETKAAINESDSNKNNRVIDESE